MLHVITFCGNMVMDGVVHPSPSPPCRASSSSLLLGFSAASAHVISGTYWFLSCTHFCMSLSLLLSCHISETRPPSPPPKMEPVLLFPRPPHAQGCLQYRSCFDMLSELWSETGKLGWKYPDVCMAEVKASVKTTQGACRYFVWVCCLCESLKGSQARTRTVGPFKLVFTVEDLKPHELLQISIWARSGASDGQCVTGCCTFPFNASSSMLSHSSRVV